MHGRWGSAPQGWYAELWQWFNSLARPCSSPFQTPQSPISSWLPPAAGGSPPLVPCFSSRSSIWFSLIWGEGWDCRSMLLWRVSCCWVDSLNFALVSLRSVGHIPLPCSFFISCCPKQESDPSEIQAIPLLASPLLPGVALAISLATESTFPAGTTGWHRAGLPSYANKCKHSWLH